MSCDDDWIERALTKFREQAEEEARTADRKQRHQYTAAVDLYCRVDEFRRESLTKPLDYTAYNEAWRQVRWSLERFAETYGFNVSDDSDQL